MTKVQEIKLQIEVLDKKIEELEKNVKNYCLN